jgi:microsomal epoxide hydrolase
MAAAGLALARPAGAGAGDGGTGVDRYFTATDGALLHYVDSGQRTSSHTIVFVPGWTMPAWIWAAQIAYFVRDFRVVAFDPRGQGLSEVTPGGYEPVRRGSDIAELLMALGGTPVLLIGWSLGVLDALAYLHTHGDERLAGLVLVDNSVGEEPAPLPPPKLPAHRRPPPYAVEMDHFVRHMFVHPPGEAYLERLVQACLVTPETASRALLRYPVPRSYWREAVYSTVKPVLYVVRPHLVGQAENLARHHPAAETAIFADAGHALFVDEPDRFNALVDDFIRRRVWP